MRNRSLRGSTRVAVASGRFSGAHCVCPEVLPLLRARERGHTQGCYQPVQGPRAVSKKASPRVGDSGTKVPTLGRSYLEALGLIGRGYPRPVSPGRRSPELRRGSGSSPKGEILTPRCPSARHLCAEPWCPRSQRTAERPAPEPWADSPIRVGMWTR